VAGDGVSSTHVKTDSDYNRPQLLKNLDNNRIMHLHYMNTYKDLGEGTHSELKIALRVQV